MFLQILDRLLGIVEVDGISGIVAGCGLVILQLLLQILLVGLHVHVLFVEFLLLGGHGLIIGGVPLGNPVIFFLGRVYVSLVFKIFHICGIFIAFGDISQFLAVALKGFLSLFYIIRVGSQLLQLLVIVVNLAQRFRAAVRDFIAAFHGVHVAVQGIELAQGVQYPSGLQRLLYHAVFHESRDLGHQHIVVRQAGSGHLLVCQHHVRVLIGHEAG